MIRPMTEADVPEAQRLSSSAYFASDQRTYQRGWPDPQPRTEARSAVWHSKVRHVLTTDPGGCWAAERDGELLGFATSIRRELMWVLGSFAVRPGLQGQGVGRHLLDAALSHSVGCLRGMFNSSQDQGALRRYHSAGFTLTPQVLLWGRIDRALLPVVRHVRDGTEADFDLCDSLDRRTRGAGHGPDHLQIAREARLIVSDRPAGSGYAWVTPTGVPSVLAATDRKTARSLMWEALAGSSPDVPVEIGHISSGNQWAIDVAMAARLEIYARGFLAFRGMKEPAPYIPHSTLL